MFREMLLLVQLSKSADDGAFTAIPEAPHVGESRSTQPFQLFSYRGCHAIEIQKAAARLH
jgi:hypothetical protein